MGLKDIWRKWSKAEDERTVERADEAARLTPAERAFVNEDFEGRKDDVAALNRRASSEAADTARDDLDLP
jgi:hypothetical protein